MLSPALRVTTAFLDKEENPWRFLRIRSLLDLGFCVSVFTFKTFTPKVVSIAFFMCVRVAEGETEKTYWLKFDDSIVAFSVSNASLIIVTGSFMTLNLDVGAC